MCKDKTNVFFFFFFFLLNLSLIHFSDTSVHVITQKLEILGQCLGLGPWVRVQGLPLQSLKGPKAGNPDWSRQLTHCSVAKHIRPHCSIHKQPHIIFFSVDTRITPQQLRFVWDRRRGPPWRPTCWCCGLFFSSSPAWPWQFQAPKLFFR